MTPEQRYPEVAIRLLLWAQYSRGGNNLPGVNDWGYAKSNLLARIKRMRDNAGLLGSGGGAADQVVVPIVVEEMEDALVHLPDDRWQRALTYQWVRGWDQRQIAKRMHVSRMTLWAWRIHAYGMLTERLYRSEMGPEPLGIDQLYICAV